MTKIHITIEDSADGVSISVHSPNPLNTSRAGQVATAMLHGGRLIARIPFGSAARHVGCDCDVCQAMREKISMKPTIH